MRIAIDLSPLIAQPTGVDRSLRGLVSALAQLDQSNEYLIFVNREDRGLFGGLAPALPHNFRILPWSGRARVARLAFQQLALPSLLRALRADVLHSTAFIMPAWRGRAGHLLTVHDMTSFLVPQHHPPSRRGRLYEAAVAASIRRADLVTVPSAAVKVDIERLLPDVKSERVRVIPLGVDDSFRPQDSAEVDRVLARLGVPRPYILYVGTLDPRKNLPILVEAYARLRAAADIPEHLVLAGQCGWSGAEQLSRAGAAPLRGHVHLAGFVAEADLPKLYAGASLFAYPSLLEGFGFPPLEAMAVGVPVLSSLTSSLRENLEGAAVLVPPDDVGQLAAAMGSLLADAGARVRCVEAGLRRAAQFRWESCARSTLGCYEAVGCLAVGR
jgi:glycosyltransferase involved in cell wall biosynthesis